MDNKKEYTEYKYVCKKSYYQDIQTKLLSSKNTKDFYSALSTFRKTFNYTNSSVPTAFEFKSLFENVYKAQSPDLVNTETNTRQVNIPYLDRDFQPYELKEALNKLSVKKAPGNDSIPNKIWKYSCIDLRFKLLSCINKYWRTEFIPELV